MVGMLLKPRCIAFKVKNSKDSTQHTVIFLLMSSTHTHTHDLIVQVYFLLQAGTLVSGVKPAAGRRSPAHTAEAPCMLAQRSRGPSCQTGTLIHFSLPEKLPSKTDRETARLVYKRAPSKHRGTCV